MIVEDENIVAKDIQYRLESLGYRVTATLPEGRPAIEKAAQDRPDLILMDIKLKGKLDGIQAASKIRETMDIPVIYLTAYADSKTIQRAKITAPFGYIVKPVDDSELKSTIELALYKHAIESRLKNSEKRHRMIFENANDIIVYIDKKGKIININKKVEDILGYKRSELLNKNFTDLFFLTAHNIKSLTKIFKGLVGSEKPLSSIEITINDKNGNKLNVEANVTPVSINDKTQGFLSVVRDITKRKKMETKLNKTLFQLKKDRQQLKLLTRKIITAQEQERRYLASEIHDDFLQSIVAILYFFQAFDASSFDKKMQEKKATLTKLIKDTIERGRSLITEIEPIRDPGIGLIQAIKKAAELRFTDSDIDVRFEHPDQLPHFDQAFETNVLRIIQEALFNIYKHARATSIHIDLKLTRQNMVVNIKDNGIGFEKNAKKKRPSRHYGLFIMQERAKLVGGKVLISSKLGRGTNVKCMFPLSEHII
jgi:PAS domain S-box-containing protein